MSPIQIVLICGILFIAFYMYRRIRSSFVDDILISIFLVTGILFVSFPELTNTLARIVGVKRGANLIFYLGFLLLFFMILKLYSKSKKLEQALTELVRQQSVTHAEDLSQ